MIKSVTIALMMMTKIVQSTNNYSYGCLDLGPNNTCECCDQLNLYYLGSNGTCERQNDRRCLQIDSNGTCTMCQKNYYYKSQRGKCVRVRNRVRGCQYYEDNGVCKVCTTRCYLVNGSCKFSRNKINGCKFYESSTKCLKCFNNKLLSLDKTACVKNKNKKCQSYQNLLCKKCQDGYYNQVQDTNQTWTCDRVIHLFDNQGIYTDKCVPNTISNCVIQSDDTTCAQCHPEYYLDATGENCIELPRVCPVVDNCAISTNDLVCHECDSGYYKTSNGTCEIDSNQCLDGCSSCMEERGGVCEECEAGKILNPSTNQCADINLPSECNQSCDQTNQCTSCATGFELIHEGTNIFCRLLEDNCSSYDSPTDGSVSVCLSCVDGYYFNASNNSCQQNFDNCDSQNATECTNCSNGYYWDGSQCSPINIDNCEEGTPTSCTTCDYKSFQINEQGVCTQGTINNCIKYSQNNANICVVCEEFHTLINNSCEPQCGIEFTENCQNVSQTDGVLVCNQCEEGSIPRLLQGLCMTASEAANNNLDEDFCISYNEDNNCQKCQSGYNLLIERYSRSCVATCPSGTTLQNPYHIRELIGSQYKFVSYQNVCVINSHNNPFLDNCKVRTRRAFSSLEIKQKEYCWECNDGFSKVLPSGCNPKGSLANPNCSSGDSKNLGIIAQCRDVTGFEVSNCGSYKEVIDSSGNISYQCIQCVNGFQQNLTNDNSSSDPNGCADVSCSSCLEGFIHQSGNCYPIVDHFDNCDQSINECSTNTLTNIPGHIQAALSCQQCNSGFYSIFGATQNPQNFSIQAVDFSNPQNQPMNQCADLSSINNYFPNQTLTQSDLEGCEAFAIFSESQDGQTFKYSAVCQVCSPGYKSSLENHYEFSNPDTSNELFVNDCQQIVNCQIPGNQANGCEQLNSNHVWAFTDFPGVPSAIIDLGNKAQNCLYGYFNSNLNIEECAVCKSGFEFDESMSCVQVNHPQCSQSSDSLVSIKFDENRVHFLAYMEHQNCQDGTGCSECESGKIAVNSKSTLLCVNDYRTTPNGVYEKTLIDQCLQYTYKSSSVKDGLICQKCESGFILSNDQESCSQQTISVNGCLHEFIQNDGSIGCLQCDANHLIEANNCIAITTVNFCNGYTLVNSVSECTSCEDEYYLQAGSCVLGDIKNCQTYLTQNECERCKNEYVLVINPNNSQHHCYKFDEHFNATLVEYHDNNNLVTVEQCIDGYYPESSTTTTQCKIFEQLVDNCIEYQQTSFYDLCPQCIACENDTHYLDTSTSPNSCKPRVNSINNCVIKKNDADECLECINCSELNNGICQPIVNNCLNCNTNQTTCTSCPPNFYLDSNQCIQRNNVSNCVSFDPVADECEICQCGYSSVNGTCEMINQDPNCQNFFSISHPECKICNSGYYYDNTDSTCKQHTFNDPNCQIGAYESDNCGKCVTEYQVVNGVCEKCPQFVDIPYCLVKLFNAQCFLCEPGYFTQQDGSCGQSSVVINDCEYYSGDNQCGACFNGFTAVPQKDQVGNSCVAPNDDNCVNVANDGKCLQCADHYFAASSYVCVSKDEVRLGCLCNSNNIPNGTDCSSVPANFDTSICKTFENCAKINHWESNVKKQCSRCESGYALSMNKKKCIETEVENCEDLREIKKCLLCKHGYKRKDSDSNSSHGRPRGNNSSSSSHSNSNHSHSSHSNSSSDESSEEETGECLNSSHSSRCMIWNDDINKCEYCNTGHSMLWSNRKCYRSRFSRRGNKKRFSYYYTYYGCFLPHLRRF